MNAECFYKEFKEVLQQLGIPFKDKDLVEVQGHLVFSFETDGKKVKIELEIGAGL